MEKYMIVMTHEKETTVILLTCKSAAVREAGYYVFRNVEVDNARSGLLAGAVIEIMRQADELYVPIHGALVMRLPIGNAGTSRYSGTSGEASINEEHAVKPFQGT